MSQGRVRRLLADAYTSGTAIVIVALITGASGLDVAIRMRVALQRHPAGEAAVPTA